MEYFSAVASLMQCLCRQGCMNESVSKQCSYLAKPQETLGRLDEQMKVLTAQETDVKHMLNLGKAWNDKEPKAEVNLWLETVEKIKESVNQITQDNMEVKRCLIKCLPNCKHLLKLGSLVDQKIQEVNKLIEQGNFSESALVGKLPERGKTLPTTRLMGESAERNIERIWNYLMDEDIGRIGIYGMGGIGKTSIMREVNNRLVRENACFGKIIWVTASRESNLRNLQKDIAKSVGIRFDDDDGEISRGAILFEALMRQSKFLLIIDDLWEAFSLEDIGIPNPEESNICKLAITTRSLTICRSMETVKEVEIEVLSTEEAWDLFKQKAGEDVALSPSIEAVAKNVAKECGGLPLSINTIGRALRKENNLRQWQIALRELQNSASSIEGMQNQVFARLRFSYERLQDDITRSCFLYCAMYPKFHHIEPEELIRYWIYDGLLGNMGNIESKMLHGYMILDELKNSCMLESLYQENDTAEHVKMHDLIRDMAIALTRVMPLFMIRAGRGIHLPPIEEEWHPDLERVSLMRNDLGFLNCEPRCPKLTTLLLQYNSISKGIEPSFFNHMLNLRVLDLSYTGIDKLPDSLSNRENLRALLLCSCWNLSHVPTLAKLKELRVLDLSYSSIVKMPIGMEMLTNLRRIDLSYCNVGNFSDIVLPKCKFLEALLLNGIWQSFGFGYIFVDVVTSYINLSILEANFSTFEDFNDYIRSGHWSQLESFKFCIGIPESSFGIGRNSVVFVGVSLCETEWPAWVSGKVLEFGLHECTGITHFPKFTSFASSKLQRCAIKYCNDMEWIITSEWNMFTNLEWLNIEALRKLSSLCKGIPPEGTLANLKVLHVSACDNLKNIISFELVHNLKNLQEIVIEKCRRVETIIAAGEEIEQMNAVNNDKVMLPRLHKLSLCSLPKLTSICSSSMICDSLSTIEVFKCPEVKILPFFVELRHQLVDSLKQIKGSRNWWEQLEKNHPDAIQHLNFLFKEEPEDHTTNEEVYFENDHETHSCQSGSSSFGPR